MSRRILTAAIVALAFGASQTAYADVIVVRASGPSAKAFAQGDILQDSAQISLVEGDSLSVMIAGGTRILRGPYVGPVKAVGSTEVRRVDFADLFKSRQRTRIAGVRTGD